MIEHHYTAHVLHDLLSLVTLHAPHKPLQTVGIEQPPHAGLPVFWGGTSSVHTNGGPGDSQASSTAEHAATIETRVDFSGRLDHELGDLVEWNLNHKVENETTCPHTSAK
jgi:hypothetical protein